MEPIQNNLREYRIKAGLTQQQVVTHLGLKSNNRLSRWESGKAYPSVVNLLKLARLYSTSVENLVFFNAKK